MTTEPLSAQLERLDELALRIALDAHRGQVDKGGQPYIWHPIRVASRFKSVNLRAVALLHDVLEDSVLTEADLRAAFGDIITDAVICLTRKRGQSYDEFIQQCRTNPLAMEVKASDLADNMDTSRLPPPLTEKDTARLAKYERALAALKAKEAQDGE